MSVLIRQAKVVDPQSEFHGQVVDISFSSGEGAADIKASSGKESSAIISDGQTLWEDNTTGKGNKKNASLYISQGFVDAFADYREPGFEHKETIHSGLRAAAAGGFTDVLLAPNTNPTISTKSSVQYVLQRANGNIIKIHPLGAITQEIEGKSLAEMLDMHANGAVAFSDGWKPVQNANLMLKALEYAKSFDGVLLQIPLDSSLSSGGLMHEGPISTGLGMAGIPVLAETILIHRDIELVKYTGSKLHITGVSTAEGVEMIRKAKADGCKVTCSVTPYHLALTDKDLNTYNSVYKVSPVLRSETDRQALIEGLKDGTIDCIASHHRPQEWDAKAKEFEYAGDGMNIQEISFSILMTALGDQVSLDRIIDALAIRPRKIFALEAPALAKKNTGAFAIFTTGGVWTLEEKNIKSASSNNPFIGKELTGKVVGILRGNNLQLNN
jgi:dihydroorotase